MIVASALFLSLKKKKIEADLSTNKDATAVFPNEVCTAS